MNLDNDLKELLNTESEFEKKRRENIEAHNEMFKQLFPGGILDGIEPTFTKIVKERSRTPRTRNIIATVQRASISRSCKRKRYNDDEDTYNSDDDEKTKSGSYIRFSFGKKKKKLANDVHSDTPIYKKPRITPVARRAYDERVAVEDLVLVAEKTSDKNYNSVDGSSCHQCRQKTDDLKTICRSRTCVGIRGQFCGPCLRNRYGECAKEAIMSTDWMCPPCRGICNCSFCMKKKGKRATGILIYLAKEHGFSDVSKFLGDSPKVKSEIVTKEGEVGEVNNDACDNPKVENGAESGSIEKESDFGDKGKFIGDVPSAEVESIGKENGFGEDSKLHCDIPKEKSVTDESAVDDAEA